MLAVEDSRRVSAFAGIAICGHCGGALHFSDWNGRARVYCYQERQVKRCVALQLPRRHRGADRRLPGAFRLPEER